MINDAITIYLSLLTGSFLTSLGTIALTLAGVWLVLDTFRFRPSDEVLTFMEDHRNA